jgi:hypothetical protein
VRFRDLASAVHWLNRRPLDATANSAATRRTPRPRIPRLSFKRKGKGKSAKLAYAGNVMKRNGFGGEAELRQVSGMVKHETAK